MKKIQKLLKKHKYICFLDFEGTQFSHEMIAFGAALATLDKNCNIKRSKKPIKVYVKAKNKIGHFVENLTGITQRDLDRVGVPFSKAMKELKKYCGHAFTKCSFMTFGNHDMKILSSSFAYNLDAPGEITSVIQKNYIDFQAVISEFIKDDNNNPFSLENYLNLFGVAFEGKAHSPEYDAYNLMMLYQEFLTKKDVVLEEYLKVLTKVSHLPEPIKKSVTKLAKGEDVTSEEFKEFAEDYIK